MKKRRLVIFIFALTFVLCGCTSVRQTSITDSSEIEERTEAAEIEIVNETEESSSTESGAINPLTGESGYNEDAVGKRPVAVMVNNIKAALPQYGIDDADIIYEIVVEGGITRLMAVYADYTNMPNVCSVRSCRYYYPKIAYGMDAIYCHWGADQTIAQSTLESLGIDRFDGSYESLGFGTLFKRDSVRAQSYASEHTGYLDGSEMANAIESLGYRTEINEENADGAFKFNAPDSPVAPDGESCETATLNFSNEYYSTFEYDEETGKYLKYHSGSPHCDGVTGNQLSFENVIVLETEVSLRDDGKHMDIGLSGGDGYYISDGKAMEITWEKDGDSSPIKLYDLNDNELTINAGKSYIGMIKYGVTNIE